MEYTYDLPAAAERHYQDGCNLLENSRLDNAGYHFGLAAECAVKQGLADAGVTASDDAMWGHFPTIKALGLLALHGRSAMGLRSLLEQDNFMQWWEIKMRYTKTGTVDRSKVNRWREQANEALGLLYQ